MTKPLYLSASRIDTYQTCSQLYAAKYIHRLPDPGNDGSNRGSVCHDVLELLLKHRHHKIYSAAIHHGTCQEVPALWKLVKRLAVRHGVADAVNLDMIDQFLMVGLTNEFHGPAGTIEAFSERAFTLEVNTGDCRWNARGFIDQAFVVKDDHGLLISIKDFKSSKAKMSGDKATFNLQSIIYQLAAKRLWPHIQRRQFRFLFLKFPKSPWQLQDTLTEDQLEGYEYVLTDLQTALEGFTLANVSDNLALFDEEKKWLCGREGLKKDGTPAWICPARKPLDYWVVVDKDGAIVRSALTSAKLAFEWSAVPTGERTEKRSYPGCVAYYGKNGQARNFA